MEIPVYVVTGSLDAGKTTFLNNLFDKRKIKALVIQFEDGEEDLICGYAGYRKQMIPRRLLDQQQEQILRQIFEVVQNEEWDEIWIEWNGAAPFSWLMSLLWDPVFSTVCRLKKIKHITDAEKLEFLLRGMGVYLFDQISESDIAIIRNYHTKKQYRRTIQLLKGINSGLEWSGQYLSYGICAYHLPVSSGGNHIRNRGITIKQNGKSVFWDDFAGNALFAYWNYAFICHSDIDSGWHAGTVVSKVSCLGNGGSISGRIFTASL